MDGSTGFKSAVSEALPDVRVVIDPFHVVHLAGNGRDQFGRCIQQEFRHRCERATDPLLKARRIVHADSCMIVQLRQHELLNLFAND